jgi:hypothetical protein
MGQPTSKPESHRSGSFPGLRFLAFKEVSFPEFIGVKKQTQGTEISKYLEERTSTETPLVVTSERGPGQRFHEDNWNRLERRAIAGDSPVQAKPNESLE